MKGETAIQTTVTLRILRGVFFRVSFRLHGTSSLRVTCPGSGNRLPSVAIARDHRAPHAGAVAVRSPAWIGGQVRGTLGRPPEGISATSAERPERPVAVHPPCHAAIQFTVQNHRPLICIRSSLTASARDTGRGKQFVPKSRHRVYFTGKGPLVTSDYTDLSRFPPAPGFEDLGMIVANDS